MTRYYINGAEVREHIARDYLSGAAERQGYDPENWQRSWARRACSEEARDFLCEVSGFTLEIVAPIIN